MYKSRKMKLAMAIAIAAIFIQDPARSNEFILKKSTADPTTRSIVGTKDRDGREIIGFVNSTFSDGAKADERGDYVEAYRIWKPLAEKGDERNQVTLLPTAFKMVDKMVLADNLNCNLIY